MFRAEDVTELLYDDPFEPFEIELTTGETFAVHHPENMIVMPRKCYVFEFRGRIAKSCRHIALAHIVRMNQLTNGKTPRRGPKSKP